MLLCLQITHKLSVNPLFPLRHEESILAHVLLLNNRAQSGLVLSNIEQAVMLLSFIEVLSVHFFGPFVEFVRMQKKCMLDQRSVA